VVKKSMAETEQPRGELVIQTIAMPKDTNRDGDIFGGWLVSQMDLGSAILAGQIAKCRVVTVAIEGMAFLNPVRVGDTVACYAWLEKTGRTSMRICVDVWVTRYRTGERVKVTSGVFTYVALGSDGKPTLVRRD
jgi:acyl-CoA thioesterase YciA